MSTTKVCSSGARRAGTWQMLALCGALIAAGLTGTALASAPPAEARAIGLQPVAGPAGADPLACTGDGVYLYEDINYGGRCEKWTTDDPLFDEENFHDIASSLRFMGSYGDGRYIATLYQDLNYGGASTAFGADDPWLGDDAIDSDQADAIRIRTVPACTGDGVYLYEGANYTGRCRKFTASEPYLNSVAFADIASSVRLVGSYAGGDTKVALCPDARYGGACSTFAGDDAELWGDVVGTDHASSLLIEPLCSAVTEIPQVECRALVALYNSTDGPHWANRNGWLINEHAVYISLVRYRVRQRPRQYPGAKAQ